MAKQKPTPSEEVEAQLARYRAMRDFSTTAEPSGSPTPSAPWAPEGGLPFVIQKHAATRLHYDFRLGWRGVLKSWACAKGPSYSTHDKRLAVEVEDHPMEYGGFEGAIPKGQYGGGTVLLWDQGTWEPLPGTDFDEGLRKGSLKFTLHGHKLQGRWTLVRMGGKAAHEGKPNWLLIKEHDGNERPPEAPAITDEAPNSVVTGRSLEEIAAAEDHVWQSHEADHGKPPANRSRLQTRIKQVRGKQPEPAGAGNTGNPEEAPKAAQQSTTQSWFDGAPSEPMPGFIPPQLATPSEHIPTTTGWLHELKLDGYRIQAHLSAGPKGKPRAVLYTRSGLDWTHRMRPIDRAVEKVPAQEAILDGELIVMDADGSTSFSKLQSAFEDGESDKLSFFVFDLLHLNGRNLRGLPLHIRKALLEPLVAEAADPLLGFSPHLQLDAEKVFAHACQLGAEGILSKQMDARYTSGRSDTWLKLKCTHRQEFVIGGFTPPKDNGAGLGSLLLGYYEGDRLIHCGRAGTGFTQATARELRAQLEPLRRPKSPFSNPLDSLAKRNAVWVRPDLVCEAQFATWTADGAIRHASFQGLRPDKLAGEVVKEATALPTADQSSEPNDASTQLAAPRQDPPPTTKRPSEQSGEPSEEPVALSAAAKLHLVEKRHPERSERSDVTQLATTSLLRNKHRSGLSEEPPPLRPAARPHLLEKRHPQQSEVSAVSQAPTDLLMTTKCHPERSEGSAVLPAAEKAPKSVVKTTRLTHPDKILDPATATTKQQLADYLAAVAPAMLPHIANRPVSIVRCPDGSTGQCFFQKHSKIGTPSAVGSIPVPDRDNPAHSEPYLAVNSPEALQALAQLGVLELHPWGSTAEALEQPDRIIFDLDPDESLPWSAVVESALSIRAFLQELHLETWVKTTGGKGLHIVAPIQPSAQWPEIRLFARGIAAAVESADPKRYLIKMTKAARKGRIFLDWMRNERGATAVAPWSPRARAGMRCAVPLQWDELTRGLPTFSVANFADWQSHLNVENNPWSNMAPQPLLPEVLEAVLAQAPPEEKARSRSRHT